MTKEIKVLDHGFVRLVDYMGTDQSIENAARVSYGEGTRKVSEIRGLIRYLIRHKHTTPLEMVEFKFHAKMPIFVARQWVRHRTASINEYSARYSVLDKEYYIPKPEHIQPQSKSNNQGREGIFRNDVSDMIIEDLKEHSERAYALYEQLLEDNKLLQNNSSTSGLTRELARMVLPLNFYTQWYWKINLHNLFHFLKLRMDSHAQFEIQEYARAIYKLIKPIVPIACEAFENYKLSGEEMSAKEMTIIRESLEPEYLEELINLEIPNKRENKEFKVKIYKNGDNL